MQENREKTAENAAETGNFRLLDSIYKENPEIITDKNSLAFKLIHCKHYEEIKKLPFFNFDIDMPRARNPKTKDLAAFILAAEQKQNTEGYPQFILNNEDEAYWALQKINHLYYQGIRPLRVKIIMASEQWVSFDFQISEDGEMRVLMIDAIGEFNSDGDWVQNKIPELKLYFSTDKRQEDPHDDLPSVGFSLWDTLYGHKVEGYDKVFTEAEQISPTEYKVSLPTSFPSGKGYDLLQEMRKKTLNYLVDNDWEIIQNAKNKFLFEGFKKFDWEMGFSDFEKLRNRLSSPGFTALLESLSRQATKHKKSEKGKGIHTLYTELQSLQKKTLEGEIQVAEFKTSFDDLIGKIDTKVLYKNTKFYGPTFFKWGHNGYACTTEELVENIKNLFLNIDLRKENIPCTNEF